MLEGLNAEQIRAYAASTEKIATAVESLVKTDGWHIFLALFEHRKQEIKDRSDYASLEEFHADRQAIDIVDGIISTFEGYVQDAKEAADTLAGIADEPPKDRGIMLIEHMEGGTIEG